MHKNNSILSAFVESVKQQMPKPMKQAGPKRNNGKYHVVLDDCQTGGASIIETFQSIGSARNCMQKTAADLARQLSKENAYAQTSDENTISIVNDSETFYVIWLATVPMTQAKRREKALRQACRELKQMKQLTQAAQQEEEPAVAKQFFGEFAPQQFPTQQSDDAQQQEETQDVEATQEVEANQEVETTQDVEANQEVEATQEEEKAQDEGMNQSAGFVNIDVDDLSLIVSRVKDNHDEFIIDEVAFDLAKDFDDTYPILVLTSHEDKKEIDTSKADIKYNPDEQILKFDDLEVEVWGAGAQEAWAEIEEDKFRH